MIKKQKNEFAVARTLLTVAKNKFEGLDKGFSRNVWGLNTSAAQIAQALESL